MAQLNAGRGRFVHRGAWSNTTEYAFLDWVTYEGSSYTCVNLSGAPAGTALSDTSYWVQMAQKETQVRKDLKATPEQQELQGRRVLQEQPELQEPPAHRDLKDRRDRLVFIQAPLNQTQVIGRCY